jgi:hypothetical protein
MFHRTFKIVNHLTTLLYPLIAFLNDLVMLFNNWSKNETFPKNIRIFGSERY